MIYCVCDTKKTIRIYLNDFVLLFSKQPFSPQAKPRRSRKNTRKLFKHHIIKRTASRNQLIFFSSILLRATHLFVRFGYQNTMFCTKVEKYTQVYTMHAVLSSVDFWMDKSKTHSQRIHAICVYTRHTQLTLTFVRVLFVASFVWIFL